MRWSFRLARILGIDLRVHGTFFLILVLGAMQWRDYGLQGMVFGVVLMSLLFLCVTLHEFGHAVVSQRLGIAVREIILLPIGGVALLSRNPDKPVQELLIAIAGPLVNVLIAGALVLYLGIYSAVSGINPTHLLQAFAEGPSWQALLLWLLNANIMLVLFNMIPAFPLDGGRVFRALLGLFMSWGRATTLATSVGQFLAIGLGLLAIFTGHILLAFIAALIFFAAGSTRAEENTREVLSTHRIGDVYSRYALTLTEADRVSHVVDYLLASPQRDFAVLRDGTLLGVVSREQVLESLSRSAEDEPVWRIMTQNIPRVQAYETLDAVHRQMQEQSSRIAAVFDGSIYLGLASIEDLSEAMIVIGCERRHHDRQPTAPPPAPLPRPHAV